MVVRVKPRMSPRTKLSGLIRQRKHKAPETAREERGYFHSINERPPRWLKYCTCIHLTIKNKALSRAMGDCSRLLIHSSSLSLSGAPSLHSMDALSIVSS